MIRKGNFATCSGFMSYGFGAKGERKDHRIVIGISSGKI
jgi:hypothetical protein